MKKDRADSGGVAEASDDPRLYWAIPTWLIGVSVAVGAASYGIGSGYLRGSWLARYHRFGLLGPWAFWELFVAIALVGSAFLGVAAYAAARAYSRPSRDQPPSGWISVRARTLVVFFWLLSTVAGFHLSHVRYEVERTSQGYFQTPVVVDPGQPARTRRHVDPVGDHRRRLQRILLGGIPLALLAVGGLTRRERRRARALRDPGSD